MAAAVFAMLGGSFLVDFVVVVIDCIVIVEVYVVVVIIVDRVVDAHII